MPHALSVNPHPAGASCSGGTERKFTGHAVGFRQPRGTLYEISVASTCRRAHAWRLAAMCKVFEHGLGTISTFTFRVGPRAFHSSITTLAGKETGTPAPEIVRNMPRVAGRLESPGALIFGRRKRLVRSLEESVPFLDALSKATNALLCIKSSMPSPEASPKAGKALSGTGPFVTLSPLDLQKAALMMQTAGSSARSRVREIGGGSCDAFVPHPASHAVHLPHTPPLMRQASAGGRMRQPDGAGTFGAQRCLRHHLTGI